jgi:hypothetical protein
VGEVKFPLSPLYAAKFEGGNREEWKERERERGKREERKR